MPSPAVPTDDGPVDPQSPQNELAAIDHRFRATLDEVLAAELGQRREQLGELAPEASELVDVLEGFLVGGKLLRPRLCFWAARAISSSAQDPERMRGLAREGAAIELLQAAALLHDDLIDRSPTRRGRPAVHVAMAEQHRRRELDGEAAAFGSAAAIILGDLALSWARDLAGGTEFSLLCTEVMSGQYLDVLHQAGGFDSPPDEESAALAVIRWKTVSYSVRRPVLMGARGQGADEDAIAALSDWSEAVGTAFQLRDDLLSVVGDEEATGKPIGGDVREGKRTVLLARTRAAADAEGRALLERVVGNEGAEAADVQQVQELMRSTGSVASVARDIDGLRTRAATVLEATAGLDATGRAGLRALAEAATDLTGLEVTD
ncbi:geranylgeranyl pyrophosphate synthase [Brachybacterium endophyticum]|uniref:Geranylgeranyl pyrophosphate synthase n=1 Tax=Brachybacterium endophyticum TaxID=2182385 RepID=A0A2U2RJ83_9MICO|nr:polyprenyl synthetase family protein [Brachybacterium endophyticum]PWH05855.1 geranylgeranyl pyrophosphate synthase [Brachybacterium endophyticum]